MAEHIELLSLDISPNDAETYVAALRNSGHAVHSHVVTGLPDLKHALETENPDIILANCSHNQFDCRNVQKIQMGLKPNTPLLLIHDNRDDDNIRTALRHGARDVVTDGDMELLQIVFGREIMVLRNLARIAALEEQLGESEHRCNTLIDNSRDAIAYIHEGMHMHANPIYLSLFGLMDMDELEGMSILDLVAPKDHRVFKKFLRDISDNARSGAIEISCQSIDEKTFDAAIDFSPARIDGEACTQLLIKDQSKSKELEQRVRLLTNHDVETGLANRQHFIEKLNEIVPKMREGAKGTLFYISLDKMQEIRAKIGVAESDRLLSEVAKTITPLVEEEDLFARFGDHTFTLFTQKNDKGATGKLADEICSKIHDHNYQLDGSVVEPPTCSIGIAYGTQKTTSTQDFIDQAFHAYESAHSEGGNQWKPFETPLASKPKKIETQAASETPPVSEQKHEEDSQMIQVLDNALEYNRFRLFYQPVVSLQGDTRENYAVMVRLLNDEDDTLLPDKFLDYAKDHGRMAAIDRWVIKHAVEEISLQRKGGRKINFFVSISGDGLNDETLLLWICDCLRLYDAKGPWITFQIADQDIRTHVQQTRTLVEGLKKIRCNLAIDHFGITPKYQSLLKHLPVDFIKLDPTFMDNLTNDPKKQDLIREISELAKEYEVKTIATGVEDANSLAALWTVGVNYIQGYFLQEPSDTIGYDFNLG